MGYLWVPQGTDQEASNSPRRPCFSYRITRARTSLWRATVKGGVVSSVARISRIRTGTPGRRTEHGGGTRDRVGRFGEAQDSGVEF